jgi:hypothetical protein
VKVFAATALFFVAACTDRPTDEQIAASCGVSVKQLVDARAVTKGEPNGSIGKIGKNCRIGKGQDGSIFLATIEEPGSKID